MTRTTLADSGFETPVVGDGNFSWPTADSAWSFVPTSGISGNHSGFTGFQVAPEGVQVAFLQKTGAFSQAIDCFVAGTYRLTFSAAQRANFGRRQDFIVLLDATPLETFEPDGGAYKDVSTTFVATAGMHTLKFMGLNSAAGDNTAFIDNVRLVLTASAP